MKHLGYILTCVVAFALGTLLPVRDTHAQTDTPTTTYYQIAFHKSNKSVSTVVISARGQLSSPCMLVPTRTITSP
jgi:hypothetical protein